MGSPKYPQVAGYDLVQAVGGGGFSTVFRAVHYQDQTVAACKHIVIRDTTTEKERKTVDKEMRIHANLKHINILEFINAVVVEMKHRASYFPGYYILLEFAAGGDLFDKIAPEVGVDEEIAHLYFNQLVEGISYLHSQGVCHRDLKPENILLDIAGALKISDFGLSAVYKLKETGKTRTLTERCGSLPYVAPELNGEEEYHAEPIDVWGIGVILFTMLAGNTPWDEPTRHSHEYCKYVSKEIFHEAPWNRFGHDVLTLICGLLTINPARRITLDQVAAHPWVSRPSQLAFVSTIELAERLTQNLRTNGDMGVAAPDLDRMHDGDDDDIDDDATLVAPSPQGSQFTQSLMLFTQTQHGPRYSPHLTRFYASLPPTSLIPLLRTALSALHVKSEERQSTNEEGEPRMRLRIGGYDKRKVVFRGWVDAEGFERGGYEGSLVVMARDEGSPISWRQLWKALILSPEVEPNVIRKR